jgi:hypothetical protein
LPIALPLACGIGSTGLGIDAAFCTMTLGSTHPAYAKEPYNASAVAAAEKTKVRFMTFSCD